jgi:hypothetical protein
MLHEYIREHVHCMQCPKKSVMNFEVHRLV